MGAFAARPIRDKEMCEDKNGSLYYGFCSMQGWRLEMEDSHVMQLNLNKPLDKWSFFGIFDGHNGSFVAEKSSQLLLQFILESPEMETIKLDFNGDPVNINTVSDGIRHGFQKFDNYLKSVPCVKQKLDKSGSTAICVFLTPKFFIFANCGDSRAMLVRDNRCYFETEDHKPYCLNEKVRIEKAGGTIISERINGCLAVSRGLGDFNYKQSIQTSHQLEQMVSPDPKVTVLARSNPLSHSLNDCYTDVRDQILVIACDGIWDVISCDELAEFLVSRMIRIRSMQKLAEEVVDLCFYKGSKDNMSAILVYFGTNLKVNDNLVLEDQYLDKSLVNAVQDFVHLQPHGSIDDMLRYINQFDFPNVPPGGLLAKRSVIERTFEELMEEEPEYMTPQSLRFKNRQSLEMNESTHLSRE